MAKKNTCDCACGKFLVFPLLVLIIGVLWFLNDLAVWTTNLPWWPMVLIVLSLAVIVKHHNMMK
ncbi:hypothetical protein CL616_02955 [archaeon]|nr:hypothetical protein [archaeon]|tara:strand:- start:1161 stop:1352 length:192 start_codon:yes stop_codon:yes gene_type:complete